MPSSKPNWDAFIQPGDFAKQIADDGVGPAGQVFEVGQCFAPHGGCLEGQHDARLRQQAPDAVEGGGVLFHETLVGTVHHQLTLLFDDLEGHEAHLGSGDGFADGRRISSIVLATLAREAVASSAR